MVRPAIADTETAPDQTTQDPSDERRLALMWIHPEEHLTPLAAVVAIGRAPGHDVRLDGPQVSRLHATIRRIGGGYALRDEGSRNGTHLNGVRVAESALCEGDVLRIGPHIAVAVNIASELGSRAPCLEEPLPGVVVGPNLRPAWNKLAKAATSPNEVLLNGPTGSGKEVFAKALHQLSGRRGRFVPVNCAALPEALIEAELFGHARGAFTGAARASDGLFCAAHEGTLLLDEVLDLPLGQQAKLLRAVEEKAITALGETTARRVDVRIVTASQIPLGEQVARGGFRADLFARLSGQTVCLPPLRARREEIPRLFANFLRAAGRSACQLRPSLIEALCLHDWPLNVRELRQAAQRAALLLDESDALGRSHVGAVLDGFDRGERLEPSRPPRQLVSTAEAAAIGRRRWSWLSRNQAQLQALEAALTRLDGNASAAAREVGLSIPRAHRLLSAARAAREHGSLDRSVLNPSPEGSRSTRQ